MMSLQPECYLRRETLEYKAGSNGSAAKRRAAVEILGATGENDYDYDRPQHGQVCSATVLSINENKVIVDLGYKLDSIVPSTFEANCLNAEKGSEMPNVKQLGK